MRKIAFSAVLLIVVLFGCKKGETAAAPPTATQATSTTATVAPTPQPTPAPQPTPTPVAAAPTAGAIASTDGEKPGMHIDITELKRMSGGTVNLKFVIANNGGERVNLSGAYLGDYVVSKDNNRDVSGIHLLDPVNKKKYFVVTDADKSCVCSKEIANLEPGGKLNLWAKFPAPPPEVTKVTIEIPHFAPIDDVTISQ